MLVTNHLITAHDFYVLRRYILYVQFFDEILFHLVYFQFPTRAQKGFLEQWEGFLVVILARYEAKRKIIILTLGNFVFFSRRSSGHTLTCFAGLLRGGGDLIIVGFAQVNVTMTPELSLSLLLLVIKILSDDLIRNLLLCAVEHDASRGEGILTWDICVAGRTGRYFDLLPRRDEKIFACSVQGPAVVVPALHEAQVAKCVTALRNRMRTPKVALAEWTSNMGEDRICSMHLDC